LLLKILFIHKTTREIDVSNWLRKFKLASLINSYKARYVNNPKEIRMVGNRKQTQVKIRTESLAQV
jgi:hypothetical protein